MSWTGAQRLAWIAMLVGLSTAGIIAIRGPRTEAAGPATEVASPALPPARVADPARETAQPTDKSTAVRAGDAWRPGLTSVVSIAEEPGDWPDSVLADAALAHPEPAVREEALHALGERGGAIAGETLRQALQDPSQRVRRAAIRALADAGGAEAVAALGTVADDADVAMRLDAADALGSIGGATAMRHLARLRQDENASVREAAAEWTDELEAHSTW